MALYCARTVPIVRRVPLRRLLVHKHHILLVQRCWVERVLVVVHEECPIIRCVAAIAAGGATFCIFDLRRYSLALAVFLRMANTRIIIAHAQILRISLSAVLARVDTLL